ncbi:50S ribosomal protein L30 [Raineya orbicola]|jgi:large subunit ribosomal protein L30|uniref:Large ribosomal subunit protein uL30 n=1 Tax=Raineya orbicola TaxID=2016530 RepID=A0A2N3IAT7_9BACT|nr:50S ribosomal protein L30 [Raineya orbicola]PKQ67385.1 Ribosomal protein L30 [Raineya orbicola]
MTKVKVTQVRSLIGRPERQHKIMASLGLGRIGKSREHTLTPQIQGMIEKVSHLVKVENL